MNETLKKLEEIRDRQILRGRGIKCGGCWSYSEKMEAL